MYYAKSQIEIYERRRQMSKLTGTHSSTFFRLTALSVALSALSLTACGGGGGGTVDSVAPQPDTGIVVDKGNGGNDNGVTGSSKLTVGVISLVDNNQQPVKANYLPAEGARATVIVKKDGKLLPGAVVTFSGKKVEFTSDNGVVLTNAEGKASIGVKPTDTTTTGTYKFEAKVEYNDNGKKLTADAGEYWFTLQGLDTKLNENSFKISPENVTSGGSAVVSLVTEDANGSYRNGVTVNFNTDCGTFSEDSVVSSNQGNVSTTYHAIDKAGNLCEGRRKIYAQLATGGDNSKLSKEVSIDTVKADSVLYSTTEDIKLGKKGSGSSSTGKIQFTVYANKTPVANEWVRVVKLASSPADLDIVKLGNQKPALIKSDSNGVVTINLYPGVMPGPVEIRADLLDARSKSKDEITDSTPVKASALSKNVSVEIGRATQGAFDISLTKNVLQRQLSGDSTKISFRMADSNATKIPDGTVVSFVAEITFKSTI